VSLKNFIIKYVVDAVNEIKRIAQRLIIMARTKAQNANASKDIIKKSGSFMNN
jgi:ABC-type molybdate transport system ATPase subunit